MIDNSVLEYYCVKGYEDDVRRILNHPNIDLSKENKCLENAIYNKHFFIVQILLLDGRVDITCRNHEIMMWLIDFVINHTSEDHMFHMVMMTQLLIKEYINQDKILDFVKNMKEREEDYKYYLTKFYKIHEGKIW